MDLKSEVHDVLSRTLRLLDGRLSLDITEDSTENEVSAYIYTLPESDLAHVAEDLERPLREFFPPIQYLPATSYGIIARLSLYEDGSVEMAQLPDAYLDYEYQDLFLLSFRLGIFFSDGAQFYRKVSWGLDSPRDLTFSDPIGAQLQRRIPELTRAPELLGSLLRPLEIFLQLLHEAWTSSDFLLYGVRDESTFLSASDLFASRYFYISQEGIRLHLHGFSLHAYVSPSIHVYLKS